jgi:hypothetical protein
MAAPFRIDEELIRSLPPEEQAQAVEQLREFNARLDANPMWRYVPHLGELGRKQRDGEPITGREQRGQVAFHEFDSYVAALVGGNRSGKTEGGLADDIIQSCPREFLPPWLHRYKRWDGEFMCRVVGQDLPRWLDKAVLPKLRKMCPPAALWRGAFDKAWDPRTRTLQWEDGSRWDFLTHDMEVDAFASVDLDRVHFDEEPKGELGRLQYEESLGRLVDRDGEVRWTLTPLLGLTLAYAELSDSQGNPRDDEECRVVLVSMDDNPHISDVGRRRYLKRFEKDPLRLEARRHGRWSHFEGLIFSEFDRNEHVAPDRDIPRVDDDSKPLLPVYASIDPGIGEKHPTGLVFAWVDVDDTVEVFYSRRLHNSTVEDVAAEFRKVCADHGVSPRWTVIDPSAKNRSAATGRSVQDQFRRHGIYTVPGQNSRVAGYNAIKERLRSGRLVLQASCTEGQEGEGGVGSLAWEFGKYRWKGRRTRSEDAPPAEPIKVDDDQLDALRYLVMSLPRKRTRDEGPDDSEVPVPVRAFRRHLKALSSRRRTTRVGGAFPA